MAFVNPGAGTGRSAVRLKRLLESPRIAEARRWAVIESRSVEEVARGLEGLPPDAVPVAAGGDGTLNMLARALDAVGMQGRVIGILPLGTGNIVAGEIGVGTLASAVRALSGTAVRRIDVMRTSHPDAPLAIVSFSAGFEGAFIARYSHLRRYGRVPAGLWASIAAGRCGADLRLEVDGEEFVAPGDDAFAVGLYNTRCYAGGVVMSPEASLCDGQGEAVVYRTRGAFWRTLWDGMHGGTTYRSDVRRRGWRTAHFQSRGPMQVDGEPIAGGNVTVHLHAGALTVLVPRTGAGGGAAS